MTVDALKAAEAYAQVARTAANAPQTAGLDDAARPDFGALLKAAASETVSAVQAGETAAAQVAAGDANLVDVVTAISQAEVTLEAAVAIRNRVIEAYQDIMRMPI